MAARKPVNEDAHQTDAINWHPPTFEEAKAMNLHVALANCWMEFDEIRRSKEGQIQNRKYMYAEYADVMRAIMPALAKYQIEVTHDIIYRDVGRDSFMFLKVGLVKNEESRSLEWPIGPISDKSQTNGANLTYAERYAICAILKLAPEDDTDGISDDRESRSHGRRYDSRDRDYPRDDDGRDPDAWREEAGRDSRRDDRSRDRRDDGRSERDGSSRSGRGSDRSEPPRVVIIALDSLRTAGNKISLEAFWSAFKKDYEGRHGTKDEAGDDHFEQVKALYIKRWNDMKNEDPLGVNTATKKKEADSKGASADKGVKSDEPPPEENHVSPDEAIRELEGKLESVTSIVEFDRLMKQYNGLIEAASQFPPDKEAVDEMIEATRERIERDESGLSGRDERRDERRDDDRDEGPDLDKERF